MELKMIFYLSNVAIVVNMSQPSVRIGGGLHALIHIYSLHGGSKSPKPHWDLKWRAEITRVFRPQRPHFGVDDLGRRAA